MSNNLFNETQKFNQWWMWLIMVTIGIIPLYGIYTQIIMGADFGDNPMSDAGLVVYACITFAVIVLFVFVRLKTVVDRSGIKMNYFPFAKKAVAWSEVSSAEVLDYGFVGGWGIRFWTKYGTVYNTSGRQGLAIQLKTGKKFLIGTQKPEELKAVIATVVKEKDG